MRKSDKRTSRTLFRTAFDKIVGTDQDTVYKVTVIQNNIRDNTENKSLNTVLKIQKSEERKSEKINLIEESEAPKAPPRRQSRPSSRNSCKDFEQQNPNDKENASVDLILNDKPPKPPPRRRSRPSSQNSCRSNDLPITPTRPRRRGISSHNSYQKVSLLTDEKSMSLKNDLFPVGNGTMYSRFENRLKPPIPSFRSSFRITHKNWAKSDSLKRKPFPQSLFFERF